MENTTIDIIAEARTAESRFGFFRSTHEALGVLTEEYHELIEAIRSNDLGKIGREAIQVAAVAMRLADHCAEPTNAFRKRSGA